MEIRYEKNTIFLCGKSAIRRRNNHERSGLHCFEFKHSFN